MLYKIDVVNGIVETDCAEAALSLVRIMKQKLSDADDLLMQSFQKKLEEHKTKTKTKREYTVGKLNIKDVIKSHPSVKKNDTRRIRRPQKAVYNDVYVGQTWKTKWGKDREIKIGSLLKDSVFPSSVKSSTDKPSKKHISYELLVKRYKLIGTK